MDSMDEVLDFLSYWFATGMVFAMFLAFDIFTLTIVAKTGSLFLSNLVTVYCSYPLLKRMVIEVRARTFRKDAIAEREDVDNFNYFPVILIFITLTTLDITNDGNAIFFVLAAAAFAALVLALTANMVAAFLFIGPILGNHLDTIHRIVISRVPFVTRSRMVHCPVAISNRVFAAVDLI